MARELRLSGQELAALIGRPLRERLLSAGFVPGLSSDHHNGFYFPISLDLVGDVTVTFDPDEGVWIFAQDVGSKLEDRIAQTGADHVQAITSATAALKGN